MKLSFFLLPMGIDRQVWDYPIGYWYNWCNHMVFKKVTQLVTGSAIPKEGSIEAPPHAIHPLPLAPTDTLLL